MANLDEATMSVSNSQRQLELAGTQAVGVLPPHVTKYDTTVKSNSSAGTAVATLGSTAESMYDVGQSNSSVSHRLQQLNHSESRALGALPQQVTAHKTTRSSSSAGAAARTVGSNAVPIYDVDQSTASVSQRPHQFKHADSQALGAWSFQETGHHKEFPSPRGNEKGRSTKALRVPFSDWLPDVAAGLKSELLPFFEELGNKLDTHMENVNKLLMQQKEERRECSNVEKPADEICRSAQAIEQDTNHPTFSALMPWQEPHRPFRPQSPPLVVANAPTCDVEEAPSQKTRKTKLQIAASQSQQLFRKSVEGKWVAHLISQASRDFAEVRESLSLRQQFAQRIGLSTAQTTGVGSGYLMKLVNNKWFDSLSTFLIVVDGLNNAFNAHTSMVSGLTTPPQPPGSESVGLEMTLASLFLLELILRICAWKWAFFFGKDWIQNTVETVILVVSFASELDNRSEYARIARSLRFFRVMRIIMRSKRLLSLRFMISSMLNCGATLMWAVAVITIVLSFFSVVFMQVASHWLRESTQTAESQSVMDALRRNYNGFWGTMVSLFMAVTGGTDWQELYQPLAQIDPLLGFCFLCYIFLMVLGVFNVLVGICADRAFAASRSNRDYVAHEEERYMHSLMKEVREMFIEIGKEGTEMITREQFLSCLKDSRIVSFFKSHQMHMIEPHWLFNMLDKDGSGSLSISELTVGLLRLSGQARSSDLLLLVMVTMEVRDEVFKLKNHPERKVVSFDDEKPTQEITKQTAEEQELFTAD